MSLTPRFVEAGPHKKVQRLNHRVLWVDGSYDHGISGWAVVEDMQCLMQDWDRGLTSNIAEGLAILSALKLLKEGESATIVTDSLSWVNAFSNAKPIKGAKSRQIYEEAVPLLEGTASVVVWVPGHTGYLLNNEMADTEAKFARLCRLSLTC